MQTSTRGRARTHRTQTTGRSLEKESMSKVKALISINTTSASGTPLDQTRSSPKRKKFALKMVYFAIVAHRDLAQSRREVAVILHSKNNENASTSRLLYAGSRCAT